MNYPYLEFFNIQYWYCVFASLFGAHCTVVNGVVVQTATSTAATTTALAAGAAKPGFFAWLFGFSGSGAGGSAPLGFIGTGFAVVAAIVGIIWSLYSLVAYLASFFLFALIVVSLGGIMLLRMEDDSRYGNLPPAAEKTHPLRARWEALLDLVMSSDPKRWREGILGADALLGELFTALGYEGKTTDEQIRVVPDSAFANLPAAWEAHRIRNFISSSSSHFILTQREAFRVMKLYEQVFREFDFI